MTQAYRAPDPGPRTEEALLANWREERSWNYEQIMEAIHNWTVRQKMSQRFIETILVAADIAEEDGNEPLAADLRKMVK